ncbi:hypothetical protein ACIBQ6_34390 [Nonomuraea sp. NPDC049655]|uniref:hypothetical protein n=1 Tax=Nonomuraea sp. NPDC049655 TaxID=3364355 RepID=UPI0037AD4444
MTHVVIQPSYGNKQAQQHWRDTLDQEVDFRADARRRTLTREQLAALESMHPSGKARFWGATGNHDNRMDTLATGDIVLFTGEKIVRGIGEVGSSFRNSAFADTMWDPHPDRGSWRNVYSLLSFQPTEIPYSEIWDLPGFNPGDNFMGMRFLDEVKGAAIIDGLGIETLTSLTQAARQELQVTASLTTSGTLVIDPEAVNVAHVSYTRSGGTTLVHRAEALLVQRYRATLNGAEVRRISTPAGITDLYVVAGDDVEIIEAKRSAGHTFVRQALGQLLDYAPHSPRHVTRLTALFPSRPADADILLLHRYGIDCIYQGDGNAFIRLSAPVSRRDHMMVTWTSECPADAGWSAT